MSAATQSWRNNAHAAGTDLAGIVLNNRQILAQLNFVNNNTPTGATIATTTTKVKLVNSTTYSTDGISRAAKSATDPFWDFTVGTGPTGPLNGATFASIPIGSQSTFLLCIATGGTQYVQQSNVTGAASTIAYVFMPDGAAIVAFVNIAVGASAAGPFVPGTTALNATGVTATFNEGMDKNLFPLMADVAGNFTILSALGGPSSLLP